MLSFVYEKAEPKVHHWEDLNHQSPTEKALDYEET